VTARLSAIIVLIVVGAMVMACTVGVAPTEPRYLTTAEPLDTGDTVLCFAVDPSDRHGVWLWGPGHNSCAGRSTGPGVFRAQDASVSRVGDVLEARFHLEMIRPPNSPRPPIVAVLLVLANGEFKATQSGARVPIVRRADLDLPEVSR